MAPSRLVPLGRIVKTHGLRGAVKIMPYGETLDHLGPGAMLFLRADAEAGASTLTLSQSRRQGKYWVIQFVELVDIDAAERVVNQEILLSEDSLPPTSEDEYYYYQLIGLRVVTTAGSELGILRAIIETGSNDVYVVEHDAREILVPATAEVILEVDLQGGRMVIETPEGLLDDL